MLSASEQWQVFYCINYHDCSKLNGKFHFSVNFDDTYYSIDFADVIIE